MASAGIPAPRRDGHALRRRDQRVDHGHLARHRPSRFAARSSPPTVQVSTSVFSALPESIPFGPVTTSRNVASVATNHDCIGGIRQVLW